MFLKKEREKNLLENVLLSKRLRETKFSSDEDRNTRMTFSKVAAPRERKQVIDAMSSEETGSQAVALTYEINWLFALAPRTQQCPRTGKQLPFGAPDQEEEFCLPFNLE